MSLTEYNDHITISWDKKEGDGVGDMSLEELYSSIIQESSQEGNLVW